MIWGKEINESINLGIVDKVISISHISFKNGDYLKEFVEFFMEMKIGASKDRRDIRAFAKLMINSVFGRFAMNAFDKRVYVNKNTF